MVTNNVFESIYVSDKIPFLAFYGSNCELTFESNEMKDVKTLNS